MLSLLSRILIKNHLDYKNAEVRCKYGILCGTVGIFFNILLFAGKYFAGIVSNSIAITADSFNNLSDAGSSFVTLIGFKLSGTKPDPEHPFGHGRIEYLSGLVVSFAIILMGFELAKSSITKIFHPEEIESGLLPMIILIASICVKLYMAFYNRSIGKKINSTAMAATATDSLSDSIATSAVLVSMILHHLTGINADGIFGTIVAAIILRTGICSAKDTISPLLGQKPDPELVRAIEKIVMADPVVIGTHDMIIHNYGPGRIIVSLHAEVRGSGDIYEIHDAIDRIEDEINTTFSCESVIHMDPIAEDDEMVSSAKKRLVRLISEFDNSVTIHDFRMVKGPTHTNFIFDAVVPFNSKKSDDTFKADIERLVNDNFSDTSAVVKIDKKYV